MNYEPFTCEYDQNIKITDVGAHQKSIIFEMSPENKTFTSNGDGTITETSPDGSVAKIRKTDTVFIYDNKNVCRKEYQDRIEIYWKQYHTLFIYTTDKNLQILPCGVLKMFPENTLCSFKAVPYFYRQNYVLPRLQKADTFEDHYSYIRQLSAIATIRIIASGIDISSISDKEQFTNMYAGPTAPCITGKYNPKESPAVNKCKQIMLTQHNDFRLLSQECENLTKVFDGDEHLDLDLNIQDLLNGYVHHTKKLLGLINTKSFQKEARKLKINVNAKRAKIMKKVLSISKHLSRCNIQFEPMRIMEELLRLRCKLLILKVSCCTCALSDAINQIEDTLKSGNADAQKVTQAFACGSVTGELYMDVRRLAPLTLTINETRCALFPIEYTGFKKREKPEFVCFHKFFEQPVKTCTDILVNNFKKKIEPAINLLGGDSEGSHSELFFADNFFSKHFWTFLGTEFDLTTDMDEVADKNDRALLEKEFELLSDDYFANVDCCLGMYISLLRRPYAKNVSKLKPMYERTIRSLRYLDLMRRRYLYYLDKFDSKTLGIKFEENDERMSPLDGPCLNIYSMSKRRAVSVYDPDIDEIIQNDRDYLGDYIVTHSKKLYMFNKRWESLVKNTEKEMYAFQMYNDMNENYIVKQIWKYYLNERLISNAKIVEPNPDFVNGFPKQTSKVHNLHYRIQLNKDIVNSVLQLSGMEDSCENSACVARRLADLRSGKTIAPNWVSEERLEISTHTVCVGLNFLVLAIWLFLYFQKNFYMRGISATIVSNKSSTAAIHDAHEIYLEIVNVLTVFGTTALLLVTQLMVCSHDDFPKNWEGFFQCVAGIVFGIFLITHINYFI